MSEEPILKLPNYQPQIYICERCKKVRAKPMTDERLDWIATTGGCDVCDSDWTECVDEIRLLREENERLKKDKEHWEDGWVEVAKARELLTECAAKIRAFLDGEKQND